MIEIQTPNSIGRRDLKRIFLAGTIDMGNSVNSQKIIKNGRF